MPVLVSHPDHVDCEVCKEHAAIPGLGHLRPKTPEEHAATCCSPEQVEARHEFEQRAVDALEPRVEPVLLSDEESIAQDKAEERWRASLAERKAHEEAYRTQRPMAEQSALAKRIERLTARARRLRYNAKALKVRAKMALIPVKPTYSGDATLAWFHGDDPTTTDLFSHSQSPSRRQALFAALRARLAR